MAERPEKSMRLSVRPAVPTVARCRLPREAVTSRELPAAGKRSWRAAEGAC